MPKIVALLRMECTLALNAPHRKTIGIRLLKQDGGRKYEYDKYLKVFMTKICREKRVCFRKQHIKIVEETLKSVKRLFFCIFKH